MTVALSDDDDKFELICTCGWEGYGFPTATIEEYADHRVNVYRGIV